ncbi:MAG: hypothetical protein JWN60_1712 [Acidobacteria bacterium]|jgi:hypothetical protein|nr:hypothetical protein [Acidobacteriota bacterium]
MIESYDPKITERPVVKCAMCDREVEHYNMFLAPDNEETNVCWQCIQREEKGFNTKPEFRRSSRVRGNLSKIGGNS